MPKQLKLQKMEKLQKVFCKQYFRHTYKIIHRASEHNTKVLSLSAIKEMPKFKLQKESNAY